MTYFLIGGTTRSELLENNNVADYPNQKCFKEDRLFIIMGQPDWNNTLRAVNGKGQAGWRTGKYFYSESLSGNKEIVLTDITAVKFQ